MIDLLLAFITWIGGPTVLLTGIGGAFSGGFFYLQQRATKAAERREKETKEANERREKMLKEEHDRKEKDQEEALSMARITVEALQDTREGWNSMEIALRAQNDFLREDRNKFQQLYIDKHAELSEALSLIKDQNRTIDRMQREIDALKSQVLTLQNGSVTRTVTDVHIVQEPTKE